MQPNPQSAIDSGIARQFGFTLIELMITLSVLAITLTVGVPSFARMIEKQRITEVAETFYSHLQEARLMAIARSEPIFFNMAADGSTTWSFGIGTDESCDPDEDDLTADPPPCSVTIDDGSGVDVPVIQRFTSADHPGIRLATDNASIEFDPRRGTAETAAITMTSTGAGGFQVIAETALLGHIRLCSPAGDSHVSRYTSTSCP
jgi:type IV fimbrial biogenesis protein FimT